MTRAAATGLVSLALLAGCGDGDNGRARDGGIDAALLYEGGVSRDAAAFDPRTVGLLEVRRVAWNAARADVGRVAAVAELDDRVAVFGDAGALVLAGGAVAATDATVREWVAAATIPAAAPSGAWVVGVDGEGRVHRLRALSALEDVSDRYGLAGRRVRAVAPMGGRMTAFGVEGAVAISDGTRVLTYMDGSFVSMAAGSGRVAGVAAGMVRLADPAADRWLTFPLPGALYAAFDADGRLLAASEREIFREGEDGTLHVVYVASPGASIHGLAASAGRVWFAVGTELGAFEGESVQVSRDAMLPAQARLVGSPSGDVWVLADGALTRYAVNTQTVGRAQQWEQTVRPAFVRACSACHLPGGSANIDLSTYEIWDMRRAVIYRRVIEQMPSPMPPAGNPLSNADREAIRAFTAPDGGM